MAVQLFKKKDFSSVYQKYMFPVSSVIMDIILSYVKDKSGKNLEMAVDVGCGTGRYTLPLAPHFRKVLGVDISDSQINLAKQYATAENVSYMVAPAEQLPLADASVDLVTAGVAAHFFHVDRFVHEAARVIKSQGCLAIHAFHPYCDIHYHDFSGELTAITKEVCDYLFRYSEKSAQHMLSQYQNIYEAVPLKDKKWITDIPVIFKMSILDITGFIQATYVYQVYKEKDAAEAEDFLKKTDKRFRDILGENADSIVMDVDVKHYCVLACKH